ncbi:MAG: polysaccharide deacetylase family protein [Hyphomicrobiaceae bacterium]
MSRSLSKVFKTALSALHYSGVSRAVAPYTRGRGVIFMLHNVHPEPPRDFEPNRILKVTPDFLETVVRQVIDEGFDLLSLDDIDERLKDPNDKKPFACFTFDDGYRDNRDFAYPIMKRFNVPFTVYVPSEFPDGKGNLWWFNLEEVIANTSEVSVQMQNTLTTFPTTTVAEKEHAFGKIYWWLRTLPECRARAVVDDLATSVGIDPYQKGRDLIMNWDELREFAKDPLVTIGAHTRNHFALAKLPRDKAYVEMSESISRLEAKLGLQVRHFSYPYGCRQSAGAREFEIAKELGMQTAVTTQKGLLFRDHCNAMTALPRLSLNGDFQNPNFVKVMLSGAPFALWNMVQRIAGPSTPPQVLETTLK